MNALDKEGRPPVSHCRNEEARKLVLERGGGKAASAPVRMDGRYLVKRGMGRNGHVLWAVCFDERTGAYTATESDGGYAGSGMKLYEISRETYEGVDGADGDPLELVRQGRVLYGFESDRYGSRGIVKDERCWELGAWADLPRED